jgi:aerobic-type carbon monoxide dehydrogenase small subunit (CoxS/CutS family)
MNITFTLNGNSVTGEADPRMTLVDFIRVVLKTTGTHIGCEHGVCGACTIVFNGEAIRSCLMLAVQANGQEVTTVEGLTQEDGTPGILQDAFRDAHGLQCGYCTPGMLTSAHALLQSNSDPSDDDIKEAIGGNICRCTGYAQIIDSIKLAAKNLREAAT